MCTKNYQVGREPDVVVFFDCPEDEMVKRLLGRNQGRVDDNIETIKKRLKVFESLNIPVIDYYSSRGKVRKVSKLFYSAHSYANRTTLYLTLLELLLLQS